MQIIRTHYMPHPSSVVRTSAKRTVRTGPFGVAPQGSVALTIDVLETVAVGAVG